MKKVKSWFQNLLINASVILVWTVIAIIFAGVMAWPLLKLIAVVKFIMK